MNDPLSVFKCLSDATRLELVRALADGPKYVELLSERLQRSPSTISFHLKKLEEAGLAESHKEQYYTVYSLKNRMLSLSLYELIAPEEKNLDLQTQRENEYREKVLKNHFEYGKLKTIPVQRKKRLIVLQKIAEQFDPDRIYAEKEVNLIIADFHDDFCTLRREMISEGLMERDKNQYWLKK